MNSLSQPNTLVNALRGAFRNEDPRFYCECGKYCPNADACQPKRGEVHQPYYAVAEIKGATRSAWTFILFDPQKSWTYKLNQATYTSPCEAATAAARHAFQTKRHPVRIDRSAQFCTSEVAWEVVERKVAQALADAGLLTQPVITLDIPTMTRSLPAGFVSDLAQLAVEVL